MAVTYQQLQYRFRSDFLGTNTAATFPVALNTTWYPSTAKFRIRFTIQTTGSSGTAAAATQILQVQKNGGGFTTVTTSGTQGVQSVDATGGLSADNAAITSAQLAVGTGSFNSTGQYDDTGTTGSFTVTRGTYCECEFALQLDFSNLNNGDVLTFQVIRGDAAAVTHTTTPTITVSGVPAVRDQTHYRTRTDATAAQGGTPVWDQALDTNSSLAIGSLFRIRFAISSTGTTSGAAAPYELYVSRNGGAYAAVSASAYVVGADATAGASADASSITSSLIGGTGSFQNTGDYVSNSAATSASIAITTGDFAEFEYGIQIGALASAGDTYAFRLYYNNAALDTYTKTPTITATASSGLVAYHLTHGETLAGLSTGTTASITPAANALIIVSVSDFTGTGNFPTSVVGNGITYTSINTCGDSVNQHCVAMYRGMSASPSTGTIVITFAGATNRITWSVEEFTGVDTSGTNGSGAVVQSAVSNTGSGGTNTGQTVTLSALGSANNAAYGFVFNTLLGTITNGASFTTLGFNTGDGLLKSEWAINQNVVSWTWASQVTNYDNAIAIEIKAAVSAAAITYVDSQSSDSPGFAALTRMFGQRMQTVLASTTEPVEAMNYQQAKTPTNDWDLHVFDDNPLRADVIGTSLKASTTPVQPRAPPPPFTGCELGVANGTDTLGLSTHNPTDTLAATCPPALVQAPCVIGENLPRRPNYYVALESTTHPVLAFAFRTAKTPTTGFDSALQDDRPMRPNYYVALESTTHSVDPLQPLTAPTATPTYLVTPPDCATPDQW